MDVNVVSENVHPPSLEETPPRLLSQVYYSSLAFLELNGWYLLGGGVVLLYIWSKVYTIVTKWLDDRAEREFRAKLHRDPDLLRLRQEAKEVAVLRLQQQHDIQAQIAEEKRKERERQREEQKRQEWLSRKGLDVARAGYRLSDGSSSQDNGTKKSQKPGGWRPEYNPLTGGGSGSSGYRPTRRTCPGGGCG